jgi:hypothetical protein
MSRRTAMTDRDRRSHPTYAAGVRRGICVKCGAATVRAARNGIGFSGGSPQGVLSPDLAPGFRGAVRNQQTDFWVFGCTTCGYLELYVLDPAGLSFMEQTWTPIPPTPPTTIQT